ncbi:MAG: tRNA uridine-5-carboxymethylaminomethyl(34) synthesis GTPase MnmE [Bacteroidales bacterium]|nr:tRNA uridine-5-carboxymethylaminomethyl(34) synthesis GTPase MnmE [Bacteroidales bacterium]
MSLQNHPDTIVAVSTPQGTGGIAVIRISGPDALQLTRQYVDNVSDEPNKAVFGVFCDGTQMLDEVVATTFRAPHSYTGEDVVEISCHGSRYIQQALLELLIKGGGRYAAPGEFTQRAFLNGKLDLSQAEAVADLIESQSESAHRLAINQLRGGFSRKLKEIRDKFVELTSLMELELDFSDEDVEFADRTALRNIVDYLDSEVGMLVESFRKGNAIKNGVPVAIIGRPNVGKSTLLNVLLNEDRAIVSDKAGTTRDTVEDTVNIGGVMFRFIDTAGIRDSDDEVETAGIARSYKAAQMAQVVLYLVDAAQDEEATAAELSTLRSHVSLEGKTFILVRNKVDLNPAPVASGDVPMLDISAKQGIHIEQLSRMLVDSLGLLPDADTTLLTNVRHYEAMTHIIEALSHVREGLENHVPADLVVVDIRDALYHLGQITGQVTSDEVLGSIFGRFCIGK